MTFKALLPICLIAAAQAQTLTTAAMQRYFNPVRHSLEASADVMPADKYSFKLTDGQMSFAEWLNHSAQRNYADCAVLKGEAAPEAMKSVESLKTKDEVSKALKDSFAYCAAALDGMTDEKVSSSPQMSVAFLHVIVHNNEIYGNIVGYMRVSGIVPPSTAARSKGKSK
jgi:uncharacterized damage-inducible protein DinB